MTARATPRTPKPSASILDRPKRLAGGVGRPQQGLGPTEGTRLASVSFRLCITANFKSNRYKRQLESPSENRSCSLALQQAGTKLATSPMEEVFSHYDSATVALIDQVLQDAGIPTLLKNWTGSNITEIPIPALYPSIHVLNMDSVAKARSIITEYLQEKPSPHTDWKCPECDEIVDGFLSECWSCQKEKPNETNHQ